MPVQKRRNPLLPWFIGVALIAVVDAFVAYRMFATSCPAPGPAEAIVIVIMPAVYIWLMYLTFKSQE